MISGTNCGDIGHCDYGAISGHQSCLVMVSPDHNKGRKTRIRHWWFGITGWIRYRLFSLIMRVRCQWFSLIRKRRRWWFAKLRQIRYSRWNFNRNIYISGYELYTIIRWVIFQPFEPTSITRNWFRRRVSSR